MSAAAGMTGSALAETVARDCEGAVFVTTMSSIALLDAVPGERDVYPAVAMMGAASSIGLGIALGAPDRDVVVLDGDGSLLMELGSLVTIAAAAPPNLLHVVLDNGVWFGGSADLPHPGAAGTDFVGLALAAGYRAASSVADAVSLSAAIDAARQAGGPVLIRVMLQPVVGRRWSDENPQPDLPDAYFDRVARQGAILRERLSGGSSRA